MVVGLLVSVQVAAVDVASPGPLPRPRLPDWREEGWEGRREGGVGRSGRAERCSPDPRSVHLHSRWPLLSLAAYSSVENEPLNADVQHLCPRRRRPLHSLCYASPPAHAPRIHRLYNIAFPAFTASPVQAGGTASTRSCATLFPVFFLNG